MASNPAVMVDQSDPLLEENVSDSQGDELMIKLSYPEEVGPIGSGELTNFLKAAQNIQALRDVQCTLGARILEKASEAQKKQEESTDSVPVAQPCCVPMVPVNAELEVTRYFCMTAPSYKEAHTKGGDTAFKPTILMELFFTYDPKKERDDIAKELRMNVQPQLLQHYQRVVGEGYTLAPEMEMETYVEAPGGTDPAKLQAQLPDFKHAAHVMVYCQWPGKLFGKYKHKHLVMMQVRFDGMLGFPGGIVDKGETPAQAVTREFNEEVGCPEGQVVITSEDLVCTHYSHHTKLCLHLFAKEVTADLYVSIEKCPQSASHWGTEVFGVVRVPLYTLPNGLGLPGFLRNAFIGNSLIQLGLGLVRRQLLTEGEWEEALKTSRAVTGVVTKEEINY